MYSDHTATLAEAELNTLELDPAILAVEDEDYQVNVAMLFMDLLDEQMAHLPNAMSNDQNSGKFFRTELI